MDVFSERDNVIDDYRSYPTASIDIKEARLKEHYQREVDADRQCPEPWSWLNPVGAAGVLTTGTASGIFCDATRQVFHHGTAGRHGVLDLVGGPLGRRRP